MQLQLQQYRPLLMIDDYISRPRQENRSPYLIKSREALTVCVLLPWGGYGWSSSGWQAIAVFTVFIVSRLCLNLFVLPVPTAHCLDYVSGGDLVVVLFL
jgi:hypothetical protein